MQIPVTIPEWIQKFDTSLYLSLSNNLSKIESEFPELLPNFQNLLNSLNVWSSLNRESILVDLTHQLFGYITITGMYEVSGNINLDVYQIFNLDYLKVDLTTKKSIEDARLQTPPTLTKEINLSSELQGNISEAIKRISLDILMGHLTPKISVSPKDTLKTIFTDFHYSNIFNSLNVGTLKIPPSV